MKWNIQKKMMFMIFGKKHIDYSKKETRRNIPQNVSHNQLELNAVFPYFCRWSHRASINV